MDIIGLLFEFIFLGMGIYIYLFTRGLIEIKDPKKAKKAAEFKKQNGTWMRILSLALIAIMLVNIVIHISQLVN